MNIGIIADSPLLTTGFGIEADQVASALTEAGHNVVCFGLKGSMSTDGASTLPFAIWHIDVRTHWNIALQDFFQQEGIELAVILIDIFNLREIMAYCEAARWQGLTLVYLTPDGIPAYQKYLDPLRGAQRCVVTTHACAQYLRSCGIRVDAIAPPGVDTQTFAPTANRDVLRERAGLENKFVVGVFGRNSERKQQPRVMQALASIRATTEGENVVVYFHCRKRDYWQLDEIARELGIQDHVLFPDRFVDEARGPASRSRGLAEQRKTGLMDSRKGQMEMPDHYGYVERISCCDLIVNASHCGDFEHIIIEAQACGVPLAHTNDEGIMAEAVGLGGLLLETIDVSRGRAGQRIFMACPQSIADAILTIKHDPVLANRLRRHGAENARQYPWARLRNTMVDLVAEL